MTDPNEVISVLVPTSPLPSHPSTDVLDATLTSVRQHLPTAPLLIMADGVRPEQEARADKYQTFKAHVSKHVADNRWGTEATFRSWEYHQHQARMTRTALAEHVRTPLVLFVEGDTTLHGDIDWPAVCDVLLSDDARVIRMHHEATILEPHQWLSVHGGQVEKVGGVPLIATAQWSQRPHLARADYYRWLLGPRHFHRDSRTMIEDVAHGVVIEDWRNRGTAGWAQHRLYIYAAADGNGSIKHSETCDGRGRDPKYPMHLFDPPGGATFSEWKAKQ